MEIKKEIIVNKNIKETWNLLGNQYADAYKWLRGLNHSVGSGVPKIEGASCNNRTCELDDFGTVKEEILKFDVKNYVLQYKVVQGFPKFIPVAINTWVLTEKGNETKVEMKLHMKTKGFMGMIMGPLMKIKISKTLTGALEDFKIYLETGNPSAIKAKQLKKVA